MKETKNIDKIREELDFSKIGVNEELLELLSLLEEVNPCQQTYNYGDDCLIISYKLRLNLFNFRNSFKFYKKVRIIGLPISLALKAYYGGLEGLKETMDRKKGLTIVLNGDKDLGLKTRTLSSFVFDNKYKNLDGYLQSLRSPYRRRLNQALRLRDSLIIRRLKREEFTEEHYGLYRSVVERSQDPLETLNIEFFRNYNGEMFEFIDKESKKLLSFIQIKELGDRLYFLFCGFHRDDNLNNDLYFNMLISILEIAFERKIKTIDFGQTSEESKLKIGCREEEKYLSIHHSNKLINYIVKRLIPFFSYKSYGISHRVFKEG